MLHDLRGARLECALTLLRRCCDLVAVAVLDLVDRNGLAVHAVVRNRLNRFGHRDGGDALAAADQGGRHELEAVFTHGHVRLETGVSRHDAHLVRGVLDVGDVEPCAHLDGAGVERLDHDLGRRLVAVVDAAVVVEHVVRLAVRLAVHGEHARLVACVDGLVHAVALVDPFGEREDLVRRARLEPAGASVRLRGIEVDARGLGRRVLTAVVLLVLRHGENSTRADLKHRHRATGVPPGLGRRHHFAQTVGHAVIEFNVNRREDLVATLVERLLVGFLGLAEDVLAVDLILLEHVLHVVAEESGGFVARDAAVRRRREVHVVVIDRNRRVLVVLLLRDVALRLHLAEDPVAAILVRLIVLGVEQGEGGRLLHRRQQRGGLCRVQLRGRDAEDLLRCRLDAVDRAAEVGDVEVGEQDLVLRVLALEADRELDLSQLAVVVLGALLFEGLFVAAGKCIHHDLLANQLHRQGRSSGVAADAELREHCACE